MYNDHNLRIALKKNKVQSRYLNGEFKTKSRIEDEAWYPAWQALLEIATRNFGFKQIDYKRLYNMFAKTDKHFFKYLTDEQTLRWCKTISRQSNVL